LMKLHINKTFSSDKSYICLQDKRYLLLPWIYIVILVVLYDTGSVALLTTVHMEREKVNLLLRNFIRFSFSKLFFCTISFITFIEKSLKERDFSYRNEIILHCEEFKLHSPLTAVDSNLPGN
jgi:hypothetical protein